MTTVAAPAATRPIQLVAGIALIAVALPQAWFGDGVFSRHTFFPLWIGYILAVDGLLFLRTQTSPWSRSKAAFIARFLISIPLWWIFEAANARLGNWQYQLPEAYGFVRYHLEASLAFSTVLPALAVTAELWASIGWLSGESIGPRFAPSRTGRLTIAVAGAAMMAASMIWPGVCFPLVWLGLFFLLDPLNREIGARSLNAEVATGRWNTAIAWMLAGLTCGIFWEMWNWRSMPKWVYDIPYADWLHIFEMPILGFGGYLPFALECFAIMALAERIVCRRWHIDLFFPANQ